MSGGERQRGGTSRLGRHEASPEFPRRLSKGQHTSAGRRSARSVTVPLARFVKGGNGPEDRRMICAARNAAEGRSHSAAERGGRERSEDGAVHPTSNTTGSLRFGRATAGRGAVSHGAAASGGVAEPWCRCEGCVRDAAARTRGETCPLQKAQGNLRGPRGYFPLNCSVRLNPSGWDEIFVVIFTPVSHQMHIRNSIPCN